MQHNDDSPKPSRPSLLTPAQQAEADRHRILSQLETGKAGKPAIKRKRSRRLLIGAGAVIVAAAVFLGVWVNQDNDAERHLAAVSAASEGRIDGTATSAPPPVAAAGAGAGAAAAIAAGAASDVSSDEVLSAAGPAAVIHEDAAAQAQDKKQSMSDMLEHRGDAAGAAAKPDANMLSSALETPSVAPAAPRAQQKAVPKEKPKAKPATVAKAPRVQEKAKSSPEEENDVALLAALVAHTQSEERQAAAPKKPRLSLDEQLAQCKKLSKTKAAQCHERVCEGRSKTGGCKAKG